MALRREESRLRREGSQLKRERERESKLERHRTEGVEKERK
jgi:hypothetical protein